MDKDTVPAIQYRESSEKRQNLAMPVVLHDFKSVIRSGSGTRLPTRVLAFSERTYLKCSIDIDFSGEFVAAHVKYFAIEHPRRSYQMICTLSDINDKNTKKGISLSHTFHHRNLWVTVLGEWKTLCTFPTILLKEDLYNFIENDYRFLLMFKFVEEDTMESMSAIMTLSTIFENGSFADFTIVVQGKEFQVHKAILATASPVFEAMFHSEMKELQENRMEINDIDHEIVKEMLRFVYTRVVNDVDKHAVKLLIAADKYRLEYLKEFCAKQLSRDLNCDNVMQTLILADTYNDLMLKNSAMQFIKNCLKKVLEKEENIEVLKSRPDFAVEILMNIA